MVNRSEPGDLASVAGYATTENGWRMSASSLDISGDDPAEGSGLYYVVKPLGCGSWQTVMGAQPGRDGTLP